MGSSVLQNIFCCVAQKKEGFIQVMNNMKVRYLNFWMNYPFKSLFTNSLSPYITTNHLKISKKHHL